MQKLASLFFSAYASFAGSMMLVRTVANQLLPYELRALLSSSVRRLFLATFSSTLTLIIHESSGIARNQVYDAVQIFLATKINPSTNKRLSVSKTQRQSNLLVAIEGGEVINDVYDNVKVKWTYVCSYVDSKSNAQAYLIEKRYYELSFNKKFKDKVMESYLPYVLKTADEINQRDKVVKLYSRECALNGADYLFGAGQGGWQWGSIDLEHPATFDTIAMDPDLKKMIIDDLERFVRRREFYKQVGKAWKRGYLLYGPPGTGKSSLVAAMANYLKFDIYDLELTSIYSNSDLRRILLSTTNRSILVIEDIDCSLEMQDRQCGINFNPDQSSKTLTLLGILNFIDGLWSSCGNERIIVFTANHKDRLDPALLRPGRMDVHINMSYCTPQGFSTLASNYLGIGSKSHHLYGEIEGLLQSTNVTPAEIAEELMTSEDADIAFEGLVEFIKQKNTKANQAMNEDI